MNTLTDSRHDVDMTALQDAWQTFDNIAHLRRLDSEVDYQHSKGLLERIWAVVGEDGQHPLGSLRGLLSSMVSDYEKVHYSLGASEPHEMLAFLVEQGERTADDFHGILDPVELDAVLAGKRKIDMELAGKLAGLFGVPATMFLKSDNIPA